MDFGLVPSEYHSRTDAEIAALCNSLTKRSIKVSDIIIWLREKGFARLSNQGPFVGSLVDFAATAPAPIADGIDKFLGFLREGSESMRTNEEVVAGETRQILGVLVASGEFEQSDVDEFYAAGGGLLSEGATEADVAAARAAYEAEGAAADAEELVRQQFVHAMDTYVSPAEITNDNPTIVQGFRDAADWMEAQ